MVVITQSQQIVLTNAHLGLCVIQMLTKSVLGYLQAYSCFG